MAFSRIGKGNGIAADRKVAVFDFLVIHFKRSDKVFGHAYRLGVVYFANLRSGDFHGMLVLLEVELQ